MQWLQEEVGNPCKPWQTEWQYKSSALEKRKQNEVSIIVSLIFLGHATYKVDGFFSSLLWDMLLIELFGFFLLSFDDFCYHITV